MPDFFYLLSARLDEKFELSAIRCEPSVAKKILAYIRKLMPLVLFLLCFAILCCFADFMGKMGFALALPVLGYFFSLIVTFVAVVLKINDTFTGNEDSEFLLSTPVGMFTQVIISFLTIYLSNLCLTALIEVPFLLGFLKYNGYAISIGRWVVGLIFTSLPVCGIATLAGMVLILSFIKMPNKNQIFTIISIVLMMLAVIIALFVMDRVYLINSGALKMSAGSTAEMLVAEITGNFKFARFYQYGIVEARYGYMFLFVGISAIWYAIFLFIHTMSYQIVVTALRTPVAYGEKSEQEIMKNLIVHSEMKSMIQKEIKQFTGSNSYIRRAMLGIIMGIAVSVNFLFVLPEFMIEYKKLIPMVISFFAAMSNVTYCSMSMEGRKVWILQTAPTTLSMLKKAKIVVNLMFSVPMVIISAIVLSIAFNSGIYGFAINLIVPTIYTLMVSIYCLNIDYKYAKFDSESEQLIVNRSIPLLAGYFPTIILPLLVMSILILI